MQGKYDPRSNMDDIRPEDKGALYLDLIVDHAAEVYAPYADLFKLIGLGNHETKIAERHGTNLISNLVHRLNKDHGGHCFVGGYGGWVRFAFRIHKTVKCSRLLKYYHGSGGGGPVTRGVIQTNRQAVYLPDADIVVNGHTHDAYHVPIARERLTQRNNVTTDIVHFIRTPTYKDDYRKGADGWHVITGKPPKPKGCAWLHFVFDGDKGIETQVILDVVYYRPPAAVAGAQAAAHQRQRARLCELR